jgi:uncharacterized protein (DUF1800 family)
MALEGLGDGTVLGPSRAAHLLRRATFGVPKSEIQLFSGMTLAAAINKLFHPPQPLPDPELPVDPATGVEWVTTGATGETEDGDLQDYFKSWFVGQMAAVGIDPDSAAAYSAREKIVYFLHTHFTCIQSKVSSAQAMYYQNQLFRLFALDSNSTIPDANFKTLTVKVSVDNAMLRLLDGDLNVRGSVNENYARELLELYSIGRGLEYNPPPNSGDAGDYGVYTEADVQTAARILTGWQFDDTFQTIDEDTLLPRGKVKGSATNASAHDNDAAKPKLFSTRFVSTLFPDNTITADPATMPGGVPTEESALDEIKKLVDLIYEQEETARNICRKIYRFFVWAPHTRDEALAVEPFITQMVETFRLNDFKIQPVIEDLLKSKHFYEFEGTTERGDDNFGGLIKSPLDLVLGTLRFFDVAIPNMTTDAATFYEAMGTVINGGGNAPSFERMSMKFYEPYDVSGYEAYAQFPIYHRAWITTNSISHRYNFARQLFETKSSYPFHVNTYDFIAANFNAQAPNANTLLQTLLEYLLPHHERLTFSTAPADEAASLTELRLNYFKQRFFSDISMTPDTYWTDSWNGAVSTTDEEMRLWLNLLFNAILQSPEYQLS